MERKALKTTEDEEEGKADMRIHTIGTAGEGFSSTRNQTRIDLPGNACILKYFFTFFFGKSINTQLIKLDISYFFDQVNPPLVYIGDDIVVNVFNICMTNLVDVFFPC